jgi:ATP-dependent exoDNAse (exonuclease V) beta subunit
VDCDKENLETLNQLIPIFENQSKIYRLRDVSTKSSDQTPLFKDIVGTDPYEKLSLTFVSKEDHQAPSSSTHYGTLVHQLMHLLSKAEPEMRPILADYFCKQNPALSIQACHKILDLFHDRNVSWIWTHEGENELEVILTKPGQEACLMRIDRLVKRPEKWVVIDYKTGQPENIPTHLQALYQNQLHHYMNALQPLTSLPVEGALLWVQTGHIEFVDHDSSQPHHPPQKDQPLSS